MFIRATEWVKQLGYYLEDRDTQWHEGFLKLPPFSTDMPVKLPHMELDEDSEIVIIGRTSTKKTDLTSINHTLDTTLQYMGEIHDIPAWKNARKVIINGFQCRSTEWSDKLSGLETGLLEVQCGATLIWVQWPCLQQMPS